MTSPAYRASTKNGAAIPGSTSIAGTEPPGAASNDIILVGLMLDRTSGSNPGTVSPPTGGYALITGFPINATAVFDYYVWWLRRGGAAPGYTPSWTNGLGGFGYAEIRVGAFSGCVSSGSPIDSSAIGTVSTTTQPDPPAVTTTTADTLVTAWALNWSGWGGGVTAPTNYTGYTDNGGFYDSAIAYRAIAAIGSEDPGTFSAADASDTAVAFTITLASVAAAAAGVSPRGSVLLPSSFLLPNTRLGSG